MCKDDVHIIKLILVVFINSNEEKKRKTNQMLKKENIKINSDCISYVPTSNFESR